MNNFDYELYDVIGIVDVLDNGNATVEVIGYIDRHGDFYRLSALELNKWFAPRGCVFAHNFIAKYRYDLQDCLVSMTVKPNEKEGSSYDSYVWDKSQEVYEYGIRIMRIKENLTSNGEDNYSILENHNLLEKDGMSFIASGNRIVKLQGGGKDRIIPFWYILDLDLVKGPNDKLFSLDTNFPEPAGMLDVTNDDQLIDWFMRKVLKPNWKQIASDQSFKNVELYIQDALSSLLTVDKEVYESRIKRLQNMTINLELTLEELQDMAKYPWIQSAIQKTVERYKDSFLSGFDEECLAQLDERKRQLQLEIEEAEFRKDEYIEGVSKLSEKAENDYLIKVDELDGKLAAKKQEISRIDQEIARKEKQSLEMDEILDSAIQRRESIVKDFSIIKEVLGMSSKPVVESVVSEDNKGQGHQSFYPSEYDLASEPIEIFEFFKKSIEQVFKANKIHTEAAWEMADIIAKYHIVLFPNSALLNSVLIAMKRCRYLTEYVGATWKSFDELWKNGLGYMVVEAESNPDLIHVLVLQNINITYLPNYMQPLVDIQNRLISRFPGTLHELPENLRIFCTITEDALIPLAPSCLKYIGCIDPNSSAVKDYYERIVPSRDNIGYLTTDLLTEVWESNPDVPNHYKSYLSNDDE